MLRVECPALSHAEVKSRMEDYFRKTLWQSLRGKYTTYEFVNYEGTEEVASRTGDETGGWRVLLSDGNEIAFIFARGSRTEAGVWRVIVDDPDPARGQELERAAVEMINSAVDGQVVLMRK